MGIDLKMRGWEDLAKMLQELPEKTQKNAMRSAIGKSARMLVKELKATNRFRDRTGALRKSIKTKRVKPTRTIVGDNVVATAPHAHLVEYGYQRKTPTGSTHIVGKRFMYFTFEANREKILKDTEEALKVYIEKKVKAQNNGK